MNAAQRQFLHRLLSWQGAATPAEIGPQVTQAENSARQTCRRKGWATFDRHYWRITDAGREAMARHDGAAAQIRTGSE